MLVLIFGASALLIGYAIEYVARRLAATDDALVSEVDALLPQTQCAQCGYPGCKPYARAIVKDDAPIDRCPPGGQTTVVALSRLLGRELANKQLVTDKIPGVAQIREADCIGCTLCINACPVDAIVGAHECMHSVIEQYCTGCELCIAPCPMDCIEMIEIEHRKPDTETAKTEIACIHCDRCNDVCPVDLAAHSLYRLIHTADIDAAINKGLSDCILCGSCDAVCPSHIPLSRIYRSAKYHYKNISEQRKQATQAQARYETRTTRMTQRELKAQRNQQAQQQQLKEQIRKKSATRRC